MVINMNNSISERLRELREEMGISQEKLASELNVTRMTIAGYELGKRPPDSAFIINACRFFDCTPDYIFGISPFKNNKNYAEWISSANTLQTSLNLLPEKSKDNLVAALNWLLQDNCAVNEFTRDKNYIVEKFINIIISYTEIFREFTTLTDESDMQKGIEESRIFEFYRTLDGNKKDIINTIESVAADLFDFLIRNASMRAK